MLTDRLKQVAARTVFTLGLGFCLPVACSPSDDVVARPAVTPDDDSCLLACGAAACPCPISPPIRMPREDGSAFAVDATEATVESYWAFLHTGTTPAIGPVAHADMCAWNTSFAPKEDAMELDPNCTTWFDFERLVRFEPTKPVVCIDWCDAAAYCTWLGGHLCGLTEGQRMSRDEIGSNAAEWYSACSSNGATVYCYGDEFDPQACNTAEAAGGGVVMPVASLPSCEGPSPGLFDMNGNADEWVAACDDFGPDDPGLATCYRVGGAFFQGGAAQSRCASSIPGARGLHGNNTGVRCCYDR